MNNATKLILYRIFAAICIVVIVILIADKARNTVKLPEIVSSSETGENSRKEESGSQTNRVSLPDGNASGTLSDERKPDYDIIAKLIYDPVPIEYTWTSFETLYYATICYSIDQKLYEYYKSLDRYYGDNEYIKYVTDPINSEYLDMVVENLTEISDNRGYSDAERVREAINFVQNFTYTTDEDNTDKIEWPKYPIEMLYDREGDCEDACLLLAGVLAKMGYGTCLIKYADHMAVGIKGDTTLSGNYYTYEGNDYYYIEATNPGWNIGDMPEDYQGVSATIILIN